MEDPPPYTEKENKLHSGDAERGCVNKGFDPLDENLKNFELSKRKDDDEPEDPWEMPDFKTTETPWDELSGKGKVKFVLWTLFRIFLFLAFLYMFICSLDFLSSAFRLLGGKAAGQVFQDNVILSNPVCGVMIGVLATVLVQSSSTTTSIVVSMVGVSLLDVKTAIPIVMGANIGTSVTNTIVSMGQITSKNDFRRAFAGATVHDMFNWMAVIVFLPLEILSGYLFYLTEHIVDSLPLVSNEAANKDLLKAITSPFTKLIVQVDKKALQKIAQGQDIDSLLKTCCKSKSVLVNETLSNETTSVCVQECKHLFAKTGMTDAAIGAILLVVSLVLLCVCLFAIVKVLNSLLQGNIRKTIKKFVNAEFPGKCKYFTGYIAILLGCGLTILVQSSSIFTSAMTPLVGVGVVSLERMYPLTLGANIGTTTTGILAAFATDIETEEDKLEFKHKLQISFCHLFFNISGILLFYPIPYLRFPIPLAKFLGNQTAKYRWFAIFYLVIMFFLFPLAIFGLSIVGWKVLAGVMIPLVVIVIIILVIKLIQAKKPGILPKVLQNWKFLPKPFRSLEPLDNLFMKFCICCKSCKKNREDDTAVSDKQISIDTRL